ncbi:serpentine type 7TM GPCR chemoreceptor srh domain-containing protein [Ditylenchus destructor]|uniref:Serpentine type 7TM GPCR chemoreceptor srh domain-containing protein n=1 Tax=Ditylenchus destructor TaxID=166010 RepID=A0AAD4MQL7_9BILA|nr:serpentine type 7TM GPCR chemoreceptor srh domain-containing protein [Ditylenchus destructor]
MELHPITEDSYSVYTNIMHINSVFNSVVTVTVIFIMLRKTPESMKTYKWYLINAVICCFALDIFVTLFFVPVTVLPWLLGGCATGLLKPLGPMATVIGWVLLSQLLGMCGTSLNFTLLYRLAAIYNRAHILQKKSVLILLAFIQIFYTTPTIIVVLLIHPPEDNSLKYVKENHPNLFDFYSTHSCSLITIEVPPLMPYIYLAIGSILFILLMAAMEIALIFYGLRKMRHKMSERSYRMHKQLTTALFIQITIPSSMICFPYLMFAIAAGWQLESSQLISHIALLFSTFHTTVNGIILIAVIRPYREAFVEYLKRAFPSYKIICAKVSCLTEKDVVDTVVISCSRENPSNVIVIKGIVNRL